MDADVASLAPLTFTLDVPCSPAAAFRYFTDDIAQWWPLHRHSIGRASAQACGFEPRVGGRLVEHTREGDAHVWGTVTQWDPPHRLAFTWHPGRDAATAQQVDVRFAPSAAGTTVTLTHDGWSALGASGAAMRAEYGRGWQSVLRERFAGYVRGAAAARP